MKKDEHWPAADSSFFLGKSFLRTAEESLNKCSYGGSTYSFEAEAVGVMPQAQQSYDEDQFCANREGIGRICAL